MEIYAKIIEKNNVSDDECMQKLYSNRGDNENHTD
jgi:hypothetical protein